MNGTMIQAEGGTAIIDKGGGTAAFDGQNVILGQQSIFWNGALRLVKGDGAFIGGYDANGNLTSRVVNGAATLLSYDAENRLIDVGGAVTTSFVYNGDGNRVKSTGSYMNLAAGIVPTGDVTINNAQVITDNDPWADDSSQYATATSGLHYVKIDLGAVYSVNKVNVWHYANDGRTYHSTKTQVSADGTSWVTVYDSAVSGEYQETAQGKEITFATQNVRYVRDYVNGNTVNVYGHWVEIEVWGYGTVTYVGNPSVPRDRVTSSGQVVLQPCRNIIMLAQPAWRCGVDRTACTGCWVTSWVRRRSLRMSMVVRLPKCVITRGEGTGIMRILLPQLFGLLGRGRNLGLV